MNKKKTNIHGSLDKILKQETNKNGSLDKILKQETNKMVVLIRY